MVGNPYVLMFHLQYLDLIALPGVEAHPLVVLAGIGNFLVINPLNSSALQEGADLREQFREMSMDCGMVGFLLIFAHF